MPVVLATDDVLELRIWSHVADQAAVNTFHYHVASFVTGIPTDLDAVNQLETAIAPQVKAAISVRATYDGMQLRIVNKQPLPAPQQSTSGAGVGSNGSNMFSSQVSGLLHFKTDRAGPGYRGRMYIPFPGTANATSNGQPDATTLGFYNTLGGVLVFNYAITDGGTGVANLEPCLYKRTNVRGADFTVITSYSASDFFATQKRRGAFGRANFSPL